MKPPRNTTLTKATYLNDYTYRFEFSNGKVFDTSFKPFVKLDAYIEYLDITKFKRLTFDKDNGDIFWGKNYDLCFHIESYYGEKTVKPRPRKEVIAELKKVGFFKRFKK